MLKNRFNLRKVVAIAICLAGVTMFSGCNKDDPKAISVADQSSLTQQVFADNEQGKSGVTFTTTDVWTSSISTTPSAQSAQMRATSSSTNWISISPESGGAGTHTIDITLETNTTGTDRTAVITISSGGDEIKITVTQKATTQSGETPTPNVKLVSRIEFYSYWASENGSRVVKTITYEFQYDEQQRVSTITYENEDLISDGVTTVTYPNANSIVLSNSGRETTLPLNSEGYILLLPNGGTNTYVNGYLQKTEKSIKVYEWIGEGKEEYVEHNGIGTTTYTWANGNIQSVVYEENVPDYPSHEASIITTYEYASTQHKSCSVDLSTIFSEGGDGLVPRGWIGKSTTNLPSEIIKTNKMQFDPYTSTYRYETDSNGYVLKVFDKKWYEDGNRVYEERLYCTISYQ